MSSRSRNSSRSSLPWRTSPKIQAPTSLSLIVATPHVAQSRASAVTHLPPIAMTNANEAKSGSNSVQDPESPGNAVTGPPVADRNDEPQPDLAQPSSPRSPTNGAVDPPAPEPDPTDVDTNTNATPETPGPISTPTPPAPPAPPRPRSWFASLSRRGSSNVPLNELAEHAPPLPPSEQPANARPASHPTVNVAAMPSSLPPEEHPESEGAPANLPNSEPPSVNAGRSEPEVKLVPKKRAWFASSSSSPKRPSKLRSGDGDEPSPPIDAAARTDIPAPILETPQPQPPVTNIIPPTPPKLELTRIESPSEPSLDTAPVPIPPARKWFSSSPSPSPQPRSPESEARPGSGPHAGIVSPRTPSSIDDQVPKLPSAFPSTESVSPPVMFPTESNQNLSSLNPSASRFSLSIPFLGRPKLPLDRAMASAQATDIRTEQEVPPISSEESPAVECGESKSGATEISPVNSVLPSGPSSEAVAGEPEGLSTQGSWWGLVGWRATSYTLSQARDPPPIEPSSDHESVAIATDNASTETDILSSNTPSHEQAPHGSTLSAETPQGQSSSWLASWPWYGQSTPTPTPGMVQPEEECANQVEVEKQIPKMAEAEDEVLKEAPVQQGTASSAHVEPANPIQSSFTANIYGWTSFLSSTTLLAKRITDTERREEDTMEVMEIDESDYERSSTIVTSETRGGKDSVARETRVTKQPPALRSPSPSPKPKAKPDDLKGTKRTSVSPAPSKSSGRASPRVPPPPNLVLPTWDDTFLTMPRSSAPRARSDTALAKTVRFVSGMLWAKDDGPSTGKGKERSTNDERFADFGRELPRIWDVIGERLDGDVLQGCKRVVVIGIHGWFPGAVMRTVLGEPTGTSSKLVNMMCQALEVFQEQHGVRIEKVTQIPLEGEGTISKRVDKLYSNLTANTQWMEDLHAADAILVATHSQGSIVSTHLLDRLIHEKHIKTSRTLDLLASASAALAPGGTIPAAAPAQRVCCLALCGIHHGPLRYLSSSSLVLPYIQYFESAAAKELFEFQNTNSEVSKVYVKALRNVVDHGVKMVYVASLNDQVVPLYSGLFTAASHPLILRALYIDGDAYHSSDFLSNLLVLLLRVMNVGLSDSGLLTHLSEATAGSLNGIGHSKAYEELATYSLAVNYLFMTNHGSNEHPELAVQPFDASTELNDYEIPWALRDLIADERVAHFFASDFAGLRNAFPDWHPKTAILRDIKRKLQPIQRLNTNPPTGSSPSSSSKL